MSILNRQQRAVIRADTGLDALLLDRCVEAFDALVERGDVGAYRQLMANAWSQMGFGPGNPVKDSDRPTALDKAKTLCVRAYADREGMAYKKAVQRLKEMQQG